MKTIILYYTLMGSTKAYATKKAEELGADIEEVVQVKPYNLFTSYLFGIPKVFRRKPVPINPLQADLLQYEKIILMSPIWAGAPAPAINTVLQALPEGKQVEFFLLSQGSGSAKSADKTMEIARARGCEVTGYTDIVAKRFGQKNVEIKIGVRS